MTEVEIDVATIVDWDSFHDYFKEKFGFPDYYGRNMDAWIDCMTYLDEPETGMSKVTCKRGDILILQLTDVAEFRRQIPAIYDALIESVAFVNYRRMDVGDSPLFILSFHE